MVLENNQECPVYFKHRAGCFEAVVLRRHRVVFLLCDGCGLLQTETPSWWPEAYPEAIAAVDTGLVQRNVNLMRRLVPLQFVLFGRARVTTMRRLLVCSWSMLVSGPAIMIYMRIDQVMLEKMVGRREVGIYSAALRLSELWYVIPMIIVS